MLTTQMVTDLLTYVEARSAAGLPIERSALVPALLDIGNTVRHMEEALNEVAAEAYEHSEALRECGEIVMTRTQRPIWLVRGGLAQECAA